MKLKKDINKIISDIAENYYEETQYDDDGNAYQMNWAVCICHGIDDFLEDVIGFMGNYDYENITPARESIIRNYAWNMVNPETIRKFA